MAIKAKMIAAAVSWSGSRGSYTVVAVHVWYVQEVRVPYLW